MSRHFIVKTEEEMRALGEALAKAGFPGEFIALFGGLGAGKTTLVRHFAAALGMDAAASPTFTIVRRYASSLVSIDHFDCYRLADADELYAVGFEDHLDTGSIIMMEWSENVLDALPPERLEVHIEGSGEEPRSVDIEAFGAEYESILEGLSL